MASTSPRWPAEWWTWLLAAAAVVALMVAGFIAAAGADHGIAALTLAAAVCLLAALALGLMSALRGAAADAKQRSADNAMLESMLDTAPDAYYYWNLRDGSERQSPHLAASFGSSEDEAGFDTIVRRLHSDDAQRLTDSLTALRTGGAGFVTTVADAQGTRRFEAEGRLLRDGGEPVAIVLWLRDISHLTAAVDDARAESAYLGAVLEALPVPIWRRNEDLTLAYCNKAYAEIVETDAKTAVTGDGIELVAEAERSLARALAEQACRAEASRSAAHHVVGGGQRRLLNVSETPLGDGDGTVGIAWDVSDLEEANRDLERHVAAHAEVLERLSTAIVIFGPDKQLKFFNSAYAKLMRLDEDWLRTEPPHGEVLETLRAQRRLPEIPDFPAFKKKREALFTELIEPREEFRHLPDGTTLRMVVTPHPFGGLQFTFEDVTDTLALERSLNTLIAVQRATLDNLHEGVAVFGSDGRLKLSNAGFAQLWRLDPKELEGEPHIADVLEKTKELYDYGDDWLAYKAAIIARTTERKPTFERLERRDDSALEWTSVPLPDGATLMTYLDVTDSIKVERALRERTEALEEADRLKSEFLANVSYELRTPLTTIIGFSEILSTGLFGNLTPRQTEYVKGIVDSSQHLLQLINDILDLASIEAGHLRLDFGSFDLDAMLASMLTLTHQRIRTENVTLEFLCPESLGEMVADERRIKQVVFHVLSNAINFTPPGGKVTLEARREDDTFAISVVDSGIGIPEEEKARVFDRFWRSDKTAGRPRGSGLGLSLVKSFVELHGGRLELDSKPGAGTRITCNLPVDARAARQSG